MPAIATQSALITALAIAALACDSKVPDTSAPAHEPRAVAEPGTEKVVENSKQPMMLVFSRDYCTPCQVMKPWVAELASENPSLDVVRVNVDRKKFEHIGSFFQISAVPSIVFADGDGHVARRIEGLVKKQQMAKALQELGWAQ